MAVPEASVPMRERLVCLPCVASMKSLNFVFLAGLQTEVCVKDVELTLPS